MKPFDAAKLKGEAMLSTWAGSGNMLGRGHLHDPGKSPEEIAEMAALMNRLQVALALQTIQNTATLSTMAEHYAQIAPEVHEEMKELVRTYARNGVEQLENWNDRNRYHEEIVAVDPPITTKEDNNMFGFHEPKLLCPHCLRELPTPPGCDPSKITVQKKGWLFSRSATTIKCPHCRGVSEVFKAGWF